MSDLPPILERHQLDESPDTSPTPSQPLKPQRVLACLLCQQRKVKCDRKFPCANCTKSRAQCVPAMLIQRQRKRRFPERELLERLRMYEALLRQNNITFEPLHKDSAPEKEPTIVDGSDLEHHRATQSDLSNSSTATNSKRGHEPKSMWHAVSQAFRDFDLDSDSSDEEARDISIKKLWHQSVEYDDPLLFGLGKTSADISTLHPDPVQIFKFWQVYLDNVNPLLKITHTPSLQGRIVEAAGNIKNIDPTLEALMFSIYCISVLSLSTEACQNMFGSSKEDLSMRYQFGCQQALLNCMFLRSSDRDCLTAFFLYLVSIRPSKAPPSLSSMLGVAIRIAQRLGIHSEPALAKCTPFEAEMRRRLWWSLMFFDTRITELATSKNVTLNPIWDCNIPANLNDSDLRPEMKSLPPTHGTSEAIFAVVRCEIGEFIRHAEFHLDFTNPALKPIAKSSRYGLASDVGKLAERIENQYLKTCDLENPIHYMTVWTTRIYLAKCQLTEHHSRYSSSSVRQTEAQRDTATSYALKMLQCDTKLMSSTLTKGYLWLHYPQFPFPAYIHIIQDIKSRPNSELAWQAWEIMSDNYDAWFGSQLGNTVFFFQVIVKLVLQAWETCEETYKQLGEFETPRIVSSIRNVLAQIDHAQSSTHEQNVIMDMGSHGFSMPMQMPMSMPTSFPNQNSSFNAEIHPDFLMRPEISSSISGQDPLYAGMNQPGWTTLGGRLS